MPARFEIIEGQVTQVVQIGHGKQALPDLLAHLSLAADADVQATKLRVSNRNIEPDVSQPMAFWAVGVSQVAIWLRGRLRLSVRCNRCIRLR